MLYPPTAHSRRAMSAYSSSTPSRLRLITHHTYVLHWPGGCDPKRDIRWLDVERDPHLGRKLPPPTDGQIDG